MTRKLSIALAVQLLASACSVTEVPPPPDSIIVNECSERADCGGGRCERGMCVAQSGSTTALFLEVTPSGVGRHITGVPFFARFEDLEPRGSNLDIELMPPSRVNVAVSATARKDCELLFVGKTPGLVVAGAFDDSIPADVTFIPRERREFPGLPTTTYGGSIDTSGWESTPMAATAFSFQINVPAGYYDVYIEPSRAAEGGCDIPPSLVRDQYVAGDFELSVGLPNPLPLDVTVRWPARGNSLAGWIVEVLDSVTGRRISTKAQLGEPVLSGEGSEQHAAYSASMLYTPVYVSRQDMPLEPVQELIGNEIVRISPPVTADVSQSLIEQVAAPTIVASRRALELFPSGTGGVIEQRSLLPAPVIVESHVNADGAPDALAAEVTIVAKRIDGIDYGVLASFVRKVQTSGAGQIALKLLPGEYEVRAVPSSASRAMSISSWTVNGDKAFQSGRVIELGPAPRLRGDFWLPASGGPNGAAVHLTPSAPATLPDALAMTLGDPRPSPRVGVEPVGSDGRFDIAIDPGSFDLTVRPEVRSRFGWYVSSPFVFDEGQGDTELEGALSAPWPVAYRGKVLLGGSDVGTPVGGTLIRAFAYKDADGQFTNDPAQARTLVQIAETRADEDGKYELLIPATLN